MNKFELYLSLFVMQFVMLGIAHFVMDWLFQKDHVAVGKIYDKELRLRHSINYGMGVVFVFNSINLPVLSEIFKRLEGIGGSIGETFLSFFILIVIFSWFVITHYLLDDRKFCKWWALRVKGMSEDNQLWVMFMLVLDQIFHLLSFIPIIVVILILRDWLL